MVSQERLKQYKSWFDNLSFFGNNSFLLDTIEELWALTNYVGSKYQKFCSYNVKDLKYTTVNKSECLSLVQSYLERHSIELNIHDLLQNDILILLEGPKEKDNYYSSLKDGSSFYDEQGNKKIAVSLEGTIFDAAVIIHEITHFRNQSIEKRSFTNDLLTESLSYAEELIFFEDLKDTIYDKDRAIHFKLFEKLIYQYSYRIYYIYKIILLYKKEQKINKESYLKVFCDSEYEKTIEFFEEYAFHQKSILKDTWTFLGLPLAVYLLEEYRVDRNFFEILKEYNERLKGDNLERCLETIKIHNLEELKEVIQSSTTSFINLLEDLYESLNTLKK